MAPQKLKIAAAGLGRMGKRHALNFLNHAPRAELVAAFSPDPAELAWAKINLEPYGVVLYSDYDTMILQPGLQAVVIGTATSVHAEEAIKAMEKNLHVLCEKPLSTDIEVVSSIFGRCLALLSPSNDLAILFSRPLTSHDSVNRLSPLHRSIHTSKSCAAFRADSTSPIEMHTKRLNKVS